MSARLFFGTAVLAATVAIGATMAARQTPTLNAAALSALSWTPVGPVTAAMATTDIAKVITDAAFPYRTCGLVAATNDTWCLVTDVAETDVWIPVTVPASGGITPDPLDGDIYYTDQLWRVDRRLGQATPVHPEVAERLRTGASTPVSLVFTADGRTLLAGTQSIWRTSTGGQTWTEISPPLVAARSAGDTDARVSALAVSPIDARAIWAGTSDGHVHVTRDAGTRWAPATPPDLPVTSRVLALEASRFDVNSAYLTVAHADGTSWLLRTRDNGTTWVDLTRTLPRGANVVVVREDPFRRGLLLIATDRSVFFSIDDGEVWQSLQGNLPDVPVRDLTIRDADILIATRGRGVWVLDDVSPLRQLTADVGRADAFLFRPAAAWRVRASAGRVASGIPGGTAVFSYVIGPTTTGPVTLEIIETVTGDVIRRFSSETDARQPGDQLLPRGTGVHRVRWDLRYARPEPDEEAPPGARVVPGTYQVRLTTAARSIRQAVTVRMDPRVRVPAADLGAQRTLARAVDERRAELARALVNGVEAGANRAALVAARDELRRIARAIGDADVRPSPAVEAAATAALARAATALASTLSR